MKRLTVSDIYVWVQEHFPFYRTGNTGWKNSIRHNLSMKKYFKKIDVEGSRARHWELNNEHCAEILFPLRPEEKIPRSQQKNIKGGGTSGRISAQKGRKAHSSASSTAGQGSSAGRKKYRAGPASEARPPIKRSNSDPGGIDMKTKMKLLYGQPAAPAPADDPNLPHWLQEPEGGRPIQYDHDVKMSRSDFPLAGAGNFHGGLECVIDRQDVESLVNTWHISQCPFEAGSALDLYDLDLEMDRGMMLPSLEFESALDGQLPQAIPNPFRIKPASVPAPEWTLEDIKHQKIGKRSGGIVSGTMYNLGCHQPPTGLL